MVNLQSIDRVQTEIILKIPLLDFIVDLPRGYILLAMEYLTKFYGNFYSVSLFYL